MRAKMSLPEPPVPSASSRVISDATSGKQALIRAGKTLMMVLERGPSRAQRALHSGPLDMAKSHVWRGDPGRQAARPSEALWAATIARGRWRRAAARRWRDALASGRATTLWRAIRSPHQRNRPWIAFGGGVKQVAPDRQMRKEARLLRADRTKMGRAERRLVLPHLTIDDAKTGREPLERCDAARHRCLAAIWRPKDPGHAFGWYAELRVQGKTSAFPAERDFDLAWCGCPHVLLRPRYYRLRSRSE